MADGGPEARGGIGDSLVDVLPYIDKEYDDPGLKDAVRKAMQANKLNSWVFGKNIYAKLPRAIYIYI